MLWLGGEFLGRGGGKYVMGWEAEFLGMGGGGVSM